MAIDPNAAESFGAHFWRWDTFAAIAAWIGALASAIILAVANWRILSAGDKAKNEMQQASSIAIEHVKAELGQAAELHKLGLKKQEWLFDKELEAVKAFVGLTSDWMPMANFPDYYLSDAARDIFPRLGEINGALRFYSSTYAPILPAAIRSAIDQCSYHIAYADLQIEYAKAEEDHFHAPSRKATDVAQTVIKQLVDIENSMLALIRS